jgi:hypothetical protein
MLLRPTRPAASVLKAFGHARTHAVRPGSELTRFTLFTAWNSVELRAT